jgi:ABC-type branched-subunit amino acid transport system ATPase component
VSALLTASNIVKHFGGIAALDGVDLEVAEGEILGLIGPNGSGKTTMVNCVSGVLGIDGGDVVLGGRNLSGASRTRRARAGIARTFQSPRLFTELSVRENVEVGVAAAARDRAAARRRVDGLLDRLGLAELSRAVVTSLPYGYQRRVEIARALVAGPLVLLLDEPAAGLNDLETAELRALLLELRDEHRYAVVVIDHDMSLILNVSDRVQVLDEGRVIFVGAPDDAFKQQQVVEAYLGVSDAP